MLIFLINEIVKELLNNLAVLQASTLALADPGFSYGTFFKLLHHA